MLVCFALISQGFISLASCSVRQLVQYISVYSLTKTPCQVMILVLSAGTACDLSVKLKFKVIRHILTFRGNLQSEHSQLQSEHNQPTV